LKISSLSPLLFVFPGLPNEPSADRLNPPSFLGKLFPLRATEMLIEQPKALAEKLFPKINACFIARDKGGYGQVQSDRETDFLRDALSSRRFARISPTTATAYRWLHETSPSP
jgi:hypothetical protein